MEKVDTSSKLAMIHNAMAEVLLDDLSRRAKIQFYSLDLSRPCKLKLVCIAGTRHQYSGPGPLECITAFAMEHS